MQTDKTLILGISGSPRNSVTSETLDIALASAGTVPDTEIAKISLANKEIQCCINCDLCIKHDSGRCMVYQDDFLDEYLELFRRCDGIILAAPVYLMNPAGVLNVFLSRMRPLSKYSRQGFFGSRMGACIAVGGMRNGGQDGALSAMNNMLQAYGTNVIGGGVHFYNGAAIWSENKSKLCDQNGAQQAGTLGKKLAYMCRIVKAGIKATQCEENPLIFLGYENIEELNTGMRLRGLVANQD
ncbi:MAG: flavodoxin family protein [Christensenellaceae bacterium]|jgi:multimeric flavodoxin WrbA|nr:flavodoxin family protein [Christensenellaceae bacterium]